MTARPKLCQTVLDATDVRELAEFYRQLFDLTYRPGDEPPTDGSPDDKRWLVLRSEGSPALAFQQDEDLVPSTWPEGEVPMQVHLDTTVPDRESLEAAKQHALQLGATLLLDESDDPDESLYVFADPAGHPFCVFVA